MKTGAGEDPFAEEDEGEHEETTADDVPAAASPFGNEGEGGEQSESVAEPSDDDLDSSDGDKAGPGNAVERVESAETPDETSHQGLSRDQFPLILRRNTVKDERPEIHQVYVQTETDERARMAEQYLEQQVGEEVYRLDAREAIYLAGLANLDDAVEILREWGYDL